MATAQATPEKDISNMKWMVMLSAITPVVAFIIQLCVMALDADWYWYAVSSFACGLGLSSGVSAALSYRVRGWRLLLLVSAFVANLLVFVPAFAMLIVSLPR